MGKPTGAEASLTVMCHSRSGGRPGFGFVFCGDDHAGDWQLALCPLETHAARIGDPENQQAWSGSGYGSPMIFMMAWPRVTQISMVSSRAQDNQGFPEMARVEFDRISKMSGNWCPHSMRLFGGGPRERYLDESGIILCRQ